MSRFLQYQTAQAIPAFAEGSGEGGGLAGAGVGLGAGVAMGQTLAGVMAGGFQTPAATASTVSPDEVVATLEKLGDLHRKGVLTDAEFSAKKAELLSKLLDILPRPKGRGFLLDGDVFMPSMNTMARGPYATLWHGLRAAKSRENVDRGIDVAIMMGSAIGACPFSDTQPCSTFRTATRNVSAA